MKLTNASPNTRAVLLTPKLYVWVMVKLLEAVSGGAKSTIASRHQQVDLFLCRESCNGSPAKRAAAQHGGPSERNECVTGAFGRRLDEVG